LPIISVGGIDAISHYVANISRKETKLSLSIEPKQVRLKPKPHDGYEWGPVPENEHLFQKRKQLFEKHLSKHSIGAYMKLCNEVGKSFEAVMSSKNNDDFEQVRRSLSNYNTGQVLMDPVRLLAA
jgi:hypothetical protein